MSLGVAIDVLVWVLCAGILLAIVKLIIDAIPMDATFRKIAYLIVTLVAVLLLIKHLLPLFGLAR